MFNSKLKKEIEIMKKQVHNLREELWILKNPPRYKIGDPIKNYKISNRWDDFTIHNGIITDIKIAQDFSNFYRIYSIFDKSNNRKYQIDDSDLKN